MYIKLKNCKNITCGSGAGGYYPKPVLMSEFKCREKSALGHAPN